MTDANSAIFVPSRSPSPTQESAGGTPYVVTSPPPDSPTNSEAAWPHQMMLEHVSTMLGVDVKEVRRQFPDNCSLLCIDSSLHIAPSFSNAQVKKIRASIRNRVTKECNRHPKECMWCGKVSHTIDDCFCIGLCRHCSRRGHTGVDCKDPHSMCLEYGDCKVYPTHPNFKCGYCAAVDDNVDV